MVFLFDTQRAEGICYMRNKKRILKHFFYEFINNFLAMVQAISYQPLSPETRKSHRSQTKRDF